jgi:extradiol dioxygenase family protein
MEAQSLCGLPDFAKGIVFSSWRGGKLPCRPVMLQESLNTDPKSLARSKVGNDLVPLHHFGAVLPWETWNALIGRLRGADWPFVMEPKVRFEGEKGEQGTFFLLDPAGNALEFKSFRHPEGMFDH